MPEQLVSTLGTSEQDNLFVGGVMPVVTETINLKSGASYVRGTVIGIVTATGEGTTVNSTASDGSQTAYGVLADDVDATSETKPAAIYLTGEFNESALVFGGTDTADTHKASLRGLSIFVKKTIGA
ncbi:head decoration protein [Neobacillus mesonae]|uniref:head decoration protein n=1 Tax=Neobacillus mesonae TaxID=1193713 RepID=UPI00203FBAE1|nr:head decoration protein [Neobacillus mesonae]MCM3567858.1 head decoration protein [Neobacillus mesonae]